MQEIKRVFHGQKVYIEKTKSPGYAQFIARKYALDKKEPIHLYICGGDGTIHEVINGILGADHIVVSIVPIGTGNDFIRSFAPLRREDFLRLSNYEHATPVLVDVLMVNDEVAVNTASFGFDVKVADRANKIKERFPSSGTSPYYLGMLQTLLKNKSDRYELSLDGQEPREKEWMFVVFCNGGFYGGGYHPCPEATVDDGIMDVCLIDPLPRRKILTLASQYERGEHVHFPEVEILKAQTARLNTQGQPINASLDGEIRTLCDPEVRIKRSAFSLLLPVVD